MARLLLLFVAATAAASRECPSDGLGMLQQLSFADAIGVEGGGEDQGCEGPQPSTVGGIYAINGSLGRGGCGSIAAAVNTQTGEEVAVKFEGPRLSLLMNEAKLAEQLQGPPGFPHVHYYGTEGGYKVMVMEKLGNMVHEKFKMNGTLNLKTVLTMGDQMLKRVEHLHSKGYVHCDVNDGNFLVGLGSKSNTIYMIDFGWAMRYLDPKTQRHIAYRENQKFHGSVFYASPNVLDGVQLSRRDDVEAVGYIMVHFFLGKLPWPRSFGYTPEMMRALAKQKRDVSLDILCGGAPPAFKLFFEHVRGLRFDEKPDYRYLRKIFKDTFLSEGLVDDGVFDWPKSKHEV